jgi:copper chaperone CopZ
MKPVLISSVLVLLLAGLAVWVIQPNLGSRVQAREVSIPGEIAKISPLESPPLSLKIPVKGMSCDSCAEKIQQTLRETSGVKGAKVSFLAEMAEVEVDKTLIDQQQISRIIKGLGYTVLDQK